MTGIFESTPLCRLAKLGSALLCLWLASASQAALFDGLYTVTVSGDAEARNVRADAERRAFAKLLTRVTGRQQAGAYPELAGLLDASAQYLSSRPLQPLAGTSNRWRFEFNAVLVNQALDDLGLPVWGLERPATLLWLAVEFPGGSRAELALDSAGGQRTPLVVEQACGGIGGEQRPVYASNPLAPDELDRFERIVGELLAACDERGLPLIVPRLDDEDRAEPDFAGVDGEDRAETDFAGVSGEVDGLIELAAERYAPDALLIARVAATDPPVVRFTQIRGERRQTLTTESLRFGLDSLADQYAAEFSIAGDARLTWITVGDVRSSEDLARIINHIDSISIIRSFDFETAVGSDYLFSVVSRGDDADLEGYLTLGGTLRRAPGLPGSLGGGGLVFLPGWRPSSAPSGETP